MLQFILGRASSGKTYTVTQMISEYVKNGKNTVLLVPEQFSFESEKNILNAVGESAAQSVSVMSFSRLCDEVARMTGGLCGESISESEKIIIMNRVLRFCKPKLKRFKNYVNSSSFSRLILDCINEFKLNFISSKDIYDIADNIDNVQLKIKLLDTALIYENYDIFVSEKFVDDTDRLTKLYYALESYRYFENKIVFIDSFKGFSGQQYKIIERIMYQAESVIITLTDNAFDNSNFGLFSNIKNVKNRIINIADKFAVNLADDIVLTNKNYATEDLCALENFMATKRNDYKGKCENITIYRSDSLYDEANFVARNIRRIVRETGARYRDFVIIARDASMYEDVLDVACKKNDVSCFIDKRIPLSSLPPVNAMLSAANVAKNFSTENIFKFHKSGINVLTVEEIATLENYTYIWGIEGECWNSEWEMDPDGFSAYDSFSPAKSSRLNEINILRKKAIEPLSELKNNFSGNAKNMVYALIKLFERCNAAEHFKNFAKEYNGDVVYPNAIRQSWDSLMRILNSLTLCFGEEQISKKEFCDALNMSTNLETVGLIPQMIDEAIFGSADRIRPSRPKYVFIMGANQGVFPRIEQNFGLFVNSERKELIEQGLEIADKTFLETIDEEYLLYSNICCASHGVFISYTSVFDGVTSAEPSSFVVDIQNNFDCHIFDDSFDLKDQLPETYEDTFSKYCESLSLENTNVSNTLSAVLESTDWAERKENVINSRTFINHKITSNTAKQLFGEKITMSASKFDTFNRCRFMYFCRYGLRVERLKSVEFSAMQRGTIVHYVLQKSVEHYGKNLGKLSQAEIDVLTENFTDEYLNMISGYKMVETPYFKYLVSNIKRTLKYVLLHIGQELLQSDFIPVKCELKIGYGGDIDKLTIPIKDYGILELIGMIDRVDTWNGYVRIIDYKTGSRNFKLPDILFGQNMQMLVYMYAILKSNAFCEKPAAILYMSASRNKGDSKSTDKMNGLVVADESVVIAMDKENKGEFIPKFSPKKPSESFINTEDFNKIFEFIEFKLKRTGISIYSGDISADPIDGIDSGACKYCEYQSICQIGNKKHKTVPSLTNSEVLSEIERQVNENGI